LSCPRNLLQNVSDDSLGMSFRHSRAGGNPAFILRDSRLRGSALHFVTYLQDTTRAYSFQWAATLGPLDYCAGAAGDILLTPVTGPMTLRQHAGSFARDSENGAGAPFF